MFLSSIGVTLPYGVTPGSFPGGIDSEFTEREWAQYQWNPPQGLAHVSEYADVDTGPKVSAKFSWQQIMWADGVAELKETRADCLRQLDGIGTARIAELYHPDAARDRNKEWQVRLSGVDLTAQDAERAQIIEVYRTLKADIERASTLAELTGIKVRRDAAGLGPDIER